MADYMTAGYQHYIAGNGGGPLKPEHVSAAAWGANALNRINRAGGLPDMVIGRPGALVEGVEDNGRTLVLPMLDTCPKCYACLNETGGATLMLAEEY